jgi:hypothetical protein
MPLILGANSVSGGYEVDNSLRFNNGSSDYLSRTPASASNRKTWTWSGWIKRTNLSANSFVFSATDGTTSNRLSFSFLPTRFQIAEVNSGVSTTFRTASPQLLDVSAWYHIIVGFDTTQSTGSDRVKVYINGNQINDFTASNDPVLNSDSYVNNNIVHNIGYASGTIYFHGYMAEVNFIDGQQLDPTDFGKFDSATGIWTPIAYTGTYGTNGFYLEFQDSSALGDDTSGNGNDFTVNNLTSVDQSTDTCTNNFATLNPLVNYQAYPPVLTEGNLKNTSNANASNGGTSPSTIVVSQGKWYAEMKVGANKQDGTALGIVTDSYRFDYQNDAAFYISASFSSVAYLGDGRKVISNTFSAYGATFTADDIIGIAVDLDNDTVTFYKNGVSQGVISTTLTGGYFICCYGYNSSVQEINFGSPSFTISSGNADANGYGNFEYAVPSGYFALCTKNLANFG